MIERDLFNAIVQGLLAGSGEDGIETKFFKELVKKYYIAALEIRREMAQGNSNSADLVTR